MTTYPDTAPHPIAAHVTYTLDPPLDTTSSTGRDIGRTIGDAFHTRALTLYPEPGHATWAVVVEPHGQHSAEILLNLETAARRAVRAHHGGRARLVELRARPVDEVERATTRDPLPGIVGIDEFCELLGVGRSRFHVLAQADDFPPPIRRGIYLAATAHRYAAQYRARVDGASPADVVTFDHGGVTWAIRADGDTAYHVVRDDDPTNTAVASFGWTEGYQPADAGLVAHGRGALLGLDAAELQAHIDQEPTR